VIANQNPIDLKKVDKNLN